MREILFRGKTAIGEWVYGNLIAIKDDTVFVIQEKTLLSTKHLVESSSIGQYTGLTDKNGTKIFEGDIVEFATRKHKVVFENRYGTAYYGIVIAENETWGFDNMIRAESIKVIGNIHDNSELIESEGEPE